MFSAWKGVEMILKNHFNEQGFFYVCSSVFTNITHVLSDIICEYDMWLD